MSALALRVQHRRSVRRRLATVLAMTGLALALIALDLVTIKRGEIGEKNQEDLNRL